MPREKLGTDAIPGFRAAFCASDLLGFVWVIPMAINSYWLLVFISNNLIVEDNL